MYRALCPGDWGKVGVGPHHAGPCTGPCVPGTGVSGGRATSYWSVYRALCHGDWGKVGVGPHHAVSRGLGP